MRGAANRHMTFPLLPATPVPLTTSHPLDLAPQLMRKCRTGPGLGEAVQFVTRTDKQQPVDHKRDSAAGCSALSSHDDASEPLE
jgi:hypothetical protein